jgi:choline dehydrogenase
LNALGIDVLVNNPNVGNHLQNHYGAEGVFLGTITSTPFLDIFTDNRPPALGLVPDGIRRIQVIGFSPAGSGLAIASGAIVAPKSRGSVHIVSKNPTIESIIDLNMYSDGPVTQFDSDAYNTVTFLKTLPLVSIATGFPLLQPTPADFASDDTLLAYAEKLANMIIAYHITGTARMGFSIADSVVNGNLHVFGVSNLMVADVSIEPVIEDGNTAYAAFFIGIQAANIIKSGLK